MNAIKLLLFLVITFPALSVSAVHDKKIIFNMGDKELPPYMFFGKDSQPQGIMYDVLQLFANKHGYEIVPVKMSKKRIRVSLKNGMLDATPRAMEWEANPNNYVFTDPVVLLRDALFSLKKKPVEFEHIDELKGKIIILRKGYIYPTLKNLIDSHEKQFIYGSSEKNMLNMLRHKRANATVISEYVGLWIIKQHKEQGLYYVSKGSIDKVGYRIMFSKQWADFVKLFNSFLVDMKKNGGTQSIVEKYIDF